MVCVGVSWVGPRAAPSPPLSSKGGLGGHQVPTMSNVVQMQHVSRHIGKRRHAGAFMWGRETR